VRVWFVVQLVSLVATMFLAARLAQFRIGLLPLAAITLLASTWDPVAQDLGLGQVTLQIVVLLLLAEWYWTRKRPALAGVLFGLSLLIKPLAWPWFLVMLRHGDWRAMAGSVGTVVVGYGLVALRLGPAPIVDYVRRVLPEISAGYVSEPTNTSVWVIGPRLFQSSPTTAAVVSGALVAALLGAVWWAAAPKRPLSYALSMATAVSTIVNPISWLYYLVLTIQPGAHVLAYLRNAGWPRAATIAAIGVGVWLSVLWRTWYALGSRDPLFGTGPTGAAIALVVLLVAIAPCGPGDR
ncbi:MAG: DUF2029 domain-containing protein, partial [Chloroflexi bacterium]|nr:DUF2029 domain-containing protein [Chloroflexota bacterium]